MCVMRKMIFSQMGDGTIVKGGRGGETPAREQAVELTSQQEFHLVSVGLKEGRIISAGFGKLQAASLTLWQHD